jgi:hypothetical protein
MKLRGVLTVLSLLCTTAFGAPRTFVSALNGSDANPCTRAAPCRSFTTALAATDPGGEVIALDSGGYGTATITSSVSIIAPGGVYAGITSFSGPAITVDVTSSGHVVLKNLYLNSLGGSVGIQTDSVDGLYVDGCSITGFSAGVLFDSGIPTARLYVSNGIIRRTAAGIDIGPGAQATIEAVRFFGNDSGIHVMGAEVTVRNSAMSGPGTYGVLAEADAKMTIEDSVASNNAFGFFANAGGLIFVTRSVVSGNSTAGIRAAFSASAIYVSDSTIADNAIGVDTSNNGSVFSRCTDVAMAPCAAGHFTNTLIGNTTNGTFTDSYLSK